MTTNMKPADILLVEDNPADVRLTQEALKRSKIAVRLHVVADGMEALAYLHKQGEHAGAVRPDLILLDLNLPKKDGREVLAEIKGDEDLKRIPVVVLTTSKSEEDVLRAYGLHANCYICKPIGLPQLVTVVDTLEDFWLTIVRLPAKSNAGSGPQTAA